MATEKVGVYRKWHGSVPVDKSGEPVPKREWPRLRPFSWAVRWLGSDGKRFSRSFKSRREADRYAEKKQAEIRVGKGDRLRAVTLVEFARMYLDLRGDLAPATRLEHERTLRFLSEFLGRRMVVSRVTPVDARRFITWYRKREYRGRTPAPATESSMQARHGASADRLSTAPTDSKSSASWKAGRMPVNTRRKAICDFATISTTTSPMCHSSSPSPMPVRV